MGEFYKGALNDLNSSGGGTDANAVHVNVANEITGVTEKTTIDNQDEFIIEDSGASFVKKSINIIKQFMFKEDLQQDGALIPGELPGIEVGLYGFFIPF